MDIISLLVGGYILLNVASLVEYYIDKRAAVKRRGRVPEARLLAAAMVAPFGAYLGIKLFRHKTRKLKFLLVPALMMVHAAMIIFLLFGPDLLSRVG